MSEESRDWKVRLVIEGVIGCTNADIMEIWGGKFNVDTDVDDIKILDVKSVEEI